MSSPRHGSEPDVVASLVRPFVRSGPAAGPLDGAEPSGVPDAVARPFLITSGRVGADSNIPMEAQVVVTPEGMGAHPWLTFEYRDIVGLCHEPLAVAEIAARLSMHLGVVRVLVGDLQEHGIVTAYRPDADDDVETILRVIHGLRLRG